MPLHFNPRPREEGDWIQDNAGYLHVISIHALVKRATDFYPEKRGENGISIHALVKRATSVIKVCSMEEIFQSTPS